jgi:flagellar hook assembly protein FlgD
MVNITIYDMMGREVRRLVNEKQSAGFKMTAWDGLNSAGSQMSAGLYFYRVQAGNFSQTKKMLLLK